MKRCLAAILAVGLLAGCGGDSDNDSHGGGNSHITGLVTSDDGLSSGALLLEIAEATSLRGAPSAPLLVTVNVTGTLLWGDDPAITLTGTYDTETGVLTVTGGGYTFSGVLDDDGQLQGTWTGPGGLSGTFVGTAESGATVYCGNYITNDEDDSGSFSFVIGGGILRGSAVSSEGGDAVALDGVVSGNSITIYFPGTTIALAVGTRNGSNVSGTFDDKQGNTGTWSGSACGGH
ncbi:MAG TPA: hypothetical protein VG817_07320 [Gemmatimonadales bacterium]|nr:hypothetical protein [Gemmatimonadales bacterium]